MEYVVGVVALLAVLFLVGRGTPLHSWPLIIAATLAVVVAVVLLERGGYWPASWRR
ncbi:MAG: hypothetical protein QOC71_1882 [Thermoplasmata archaeon]|jgi:hypothetical protein|nr:hypothetical protein [Thermoplasmata archaeon]HKH94984.1 hypothetical protein [Beijerinckiaceae bacterium]